MTQEKLYQLSRRAAQQLLEVLERGDVQQIEDKLAALRHYIELAEMIPADNLRGDALHHREQIEVLAGITEHLGRALDGIRRRVTEEIERLGPNRALLRHLIA